MSLISPIFVLFYWLERRLLTSARPRCSRLSFSRGQLPKAVLRCPVAMRYYALLHALDWNRVLERSFQPGWRQAPTSYQAVVSACLVKLDQQLDSMPRLRLYLCEHPALAWLLGFTAHPWDDPDQVLPTARHFTRLLRQMPHDVPDHLPNETVRLLKSQLPGLGEAISLDTKHILAWVKENNPKDYVSDRHNKAHQPKADADCKLGCKRRRNARPEVATPSQEAQPASHIGSGIGEFYWGYASGVVACKVNSTECVLAELTQTFDKSDVSYFEPLMAQVERRLGRKPRFGAFDAAFDAFYIYEYFACGNDWREGFAAIPMSARCKPTRFDEHGQPLCAAGLSMVAAYTFVCRTTLVEHERTHYVCPFKGQREALCPIGDAHFAKGGCTHRLPSSIGARLRHQIEHESPLYKEIYRQRTATERINSQAVALGIERPHLRNQVAIANQNTLIYTLINLRAWQRACASEHPI